MTADKTHLDPRARRTLDALQGALAEHMRNQQLSEISVSEICRTAGVHRTTFYKHFESVAELAALSVNDLVDGITSGTVGTAARDPEATEDPEDAKTADAENGDGDAGGPGAAGAGSGPATSFAQWAQALAHQLTVQRETYYAIFGPKGDPGMQRALAERIVDAARRAMTASGQGQKAGGLSHDGGAQVVGNAVYGGVVALVSATDEDPAVVWGAIHQALPQEWQQAVEADWTGVSD